MGLASLADFAVDVTITDPPYEAAAHTQGRRTKSGAGTTHAPGGKDWRSRAARGEAVAEAAPLPFAAIAQDEREAVADQIVRVTRRWILVFCQVEAAHLWRGALCSAGPVDYVRTMIWVKPDGQPQFTGDRPGVGYESIVVCHRKGRKRWNGGGRLGVFKHTRAPASNGKAPHPTTKPLSLMEELIGLFSDEGELVCDPYAGSGSTGVAALKHGRRFTGWELDPEFHARAERRLRGDAWRVSDVQADLFAGAGAA